MNGVPEHRDNLVQLEAHDGDIQTSAGHSMGTPHDAAGGLLDWRRYVAALGRYKWLIIISPLFGAALGFVASQVIPREYVSGATIWIENSADPKGPKLGPIRSEELLRAVSWAELLRSSLVLDRVVEDLHLYFSMDNPEDSAIFADFGARRPFRAGRYQLTVNSTGDSVVLTSKDLLGTIEIARAAVGDSIGQTVGFPWLPPPSALHPEQEIGFALQGISEASRDLSKKLKVTTDLNGNFMRVALIGRNPRLTAATVNAVTERYIDVAAELKREKLTELARIVGEQLHQAETNLREAENALENYRIETITLPSESATPVSPGLQMTRDPVYRNYFTMQMDLDQIKQDQEAIERALADARDTIIPIEALSAIPAVQTSELNVALRELTDKRAEVRSMQYRYTGEHPPLQELAAAVDTLEKKTIPQLAGLLLSDLAARERQLNSRIRAAGQDLRDIPPRAIREARLERQVRIADNLYTTLEHRYEEARLAEASSIPDVRILERAVEAQQPVKNLMLFLLLGGAVGGPAAGIVLALLFDQVDRRLRYPNQVTAGLGLHILGAVPHLKSNGKGLATAPLIEAFRGVQLNLTYADGLNRPLMLTVTSPGPGDGKSFVAANLALAFADAGHQTVLVDGDIRRGALHRMIATPQNPGLTDVLSRRTPVDAATRETEFTRLSFLPSGTRLSRAPELLGSASMTELLAVLRERYSVIIVDSPPLGAGMDAYALGAATGKMILVVRTGTTDRGMAQTKLQLLDRFPVRIFGAVINDVRPGTVYGSYSYHMDGYEYQVESDQAGARKKLLANGRTPREG